MSAEPWYPVAPNDIFPEEFTPFLISSTKVRETFLAHHSDLLTPDFWNACKHSIEQGNIEDVFPYRDEARFARRFAGTKPTRGDTA